MTTIDEMRFPTPDEIEGFWAFDKMHAPRPLHPLSQDLVMATISRGFTQAQAEYDCPVVTSSQAINHYFYMAFHPHPDPAVIEDRMTRYLGMVDKTVPLVGKRWQSEWLPLIKQRNEAERDVDYSTMSDEALFARYHEMVRWMEQMWYIHGHINFALISGAALSDFYDEVMQPADPTEAYQILQGYHTRPVDAAHGLWNLSRVAKASPELSRIFDEHHQRDLHAALAGSDEGRAFLAQLDEYLFDFGWRSDAVYDLADIPWIEDPQIPLGNIARYIPMDDSADPMIGFDGRGRSGARRSPPTSAPSWPAIRRSWQSSRSCSTPPSTRTRSPRTTRSTSIRWAWCCSVGSSAPWASASRSAARSTPATTCSSSTTVRSATRSRTAPTSAAW